MPRRRARRCTSIFDRSARCGWFSGWSSTSCTVPQTPCASSTIMRARAPVTTPSATPRQNATARSRDSGCMKLTEAPPSTQSINTSASSSICWSSGADNRRTDQVAALIVSTRARMPYGRAASTLFELKVLERRRVGEAGNHIRPAHLDARPDSPDEGEIVDRHVQHVLGHGLLHLMDEDLALLEVDLSGLAREEIVDLGQRAVGVNAAFRGIGLESRGRVAHDRRDHKDDAVQLLLPPRREVGGTLHRPQAALDTDRL